MRAFTPGFICVVSGRSDPHPEVQEFLHQERGFGQSLGDALSATMGVGPARPSATVLVAAGGAAPRGPPADVGPPPFDDPIGS